MPNQGVCKGCGKKIVWGTTADGKRIPLDPAPPVYRVMDRETGGGFQETVATRVNAYMVSHFATCPKANRFSGSKKEKH